MTENNITFNQLGLSEPLLNSVAELGFTTPSPIQEICIPLILNGQDVLGMAQTGSGKTAAFALPLIAQIEASKKYPQMLVMAPTRELAIQVAEACEHFAKFIKQIRVATLYGGQRYDIQLRALKQGAQIIVGTPGRILDHIRRGTLSLSELKAIVLDEADEMLRMGFIDDVETVMSGLPENHQTALFSATMPEPIRRITKRFMKNPQEIKIQSSKQTAPDITQSYWSVNGFRKNEALLRFLEIEDFDAAIIFMRTKSGTLEVTNFLERHGFNAAALNGDMTQQLREQTLDQLKNKSINIIVATDVAARGIDIDRLSLVINYDIPLDAESYVHRIGRTGRAGRAGRALLFVEPRERRLLRNIEQLMKTAINEIQLPDHKLLETRRRQKFHDQVAKQLEHHNLEQYRSLLEDLFTADQDRDDIAAAMMMLLQGGKPLILPPDPVISRQKATREYANGRGDKFSRGGRNSNGKFDRRNGANLSERGGYNSPQMDLYRIEVGLADGVEVRHIVGAIANEGDINSRYIGHIKLFDDHTTIELPKELSKEILQRFTKTRVLNKPMQMSLMDKQASSSKSNYGQRNYDNKYDNKNRQDHQGNRHKKNSPFSEKQAVFNERGNRSDNRSSRIERREFRTRKD